MTALTIERTTVPRGRKDLTDMFISRASEHQINALKKKLRDSGASKAVVYAVYPVRKDYGQRTKIEPIDETPLRGLTWFARVEGGPLDKCHIMISPDGFDTELYISHYYTNLDSFDYGHEIYPGVAPEDYRDRVNEEQEEQDRLEEEEDYYENDDDDLL